MELTCSKVEHLSNDENLKALGGLLNEFNPFSVLKLDHYEIRHSNMLAWLLQPSENHGLRDQFLKKLLGEIIESGNSEEPIDLTAQEIEGWDFSDAVVMREYKYIDVLLVSKVNKFVLLIENKVRAGLGEEQLQRYWGVVEEDYPGYQVLPVFLTLQGDEPNHGKYYSFSHARVYENLKHTVSELKGHLEPNVADFLHYYIKLLGRLTMEDNATKELAENVYREHKDAIDFILEHVVNRILAFSGYHEAIDSYKKTYSIVTDAGKLDIQAPFNFYKSKAEYWFVPEGFAKMPILSNKWKSPLMMSYFFTRDDQTVKLHLEVGPFHDRKKRLAWLNYLNDNGGDLFKIHSGALQKLGGQYTKVRSRSIRFSEWDDEDLARDTIDRLFKNFEYERVNQEVLRFLTEFEKEQGEFQ